MKTFEIHVVFDSRHEAQCHFDYWHSPFGHRLVRIRRFFNWRHLRFLYAVIVEFDENENQAIVETQVRGEFERRQEFVLFYTPGNGMKYARKIIYIPMVTLTSEQLGYSPGDFPDGVYISGQGTLNTN